jgi:hypothetical protein
MRRGPHGGLGCAPRWHLRIRCSGPRGRRRACAVSKPSSPAWGGRIPRCKLRSVQSNGLRCVAAVGAPALPDDAATRFVRLRPVSIEYGTRAGVVPPAHLRFGEGPRCQPFSAAFDAAAHPSNAVSARVRTQMSAGIAIAAAMPSQQQARGIVARKQRGGGCLKSPADLRQSLPVSATSGMNSTAEAFAVGVAMGGRAA